MTPLRAPYLSNSKNYWDVTVIFLIPRAPVIVNKTERESRQNGPKQIRDYVGLGNAYF